MPRAISLTIAAITALLACSGESLVATDDQPSPQSAAAVYTATELVTGGADTTTDPYTIERLSVKNDSLRLTVRYGGGCRTHEFRLQLSSIFRESYPVQSHALLAHEANGDTCFSLIEREMRFDLKPLRDLYRRSYQTQSGVVHLRLVAPGSGVVEYRF